jgi:ABC-2 type transport system ATP-binding protein
MLHLTRNLNRRFDQHYAEARLGELGIPPKRKSGKLSGGQQAQLALTLALARRPRLLVLDEPVAMLDPIARHDFMATVLTAMADDGVSVVLSSHVLAELERVADYLVLLSRGRVQLAGEIEDLLASHRMLTGPAAEADRYAQRPVVHARRAEAQAHLLVRATASDTVPPGWEAQPVGLEELALAYLRQPGAAALPARPATEALSCRRRRNDHSDRGFRPARRRQPTAGAVAADGLGHLAAAPDRAGRRSRVSRRVRHIRVAERPSAA